MNEDPCDNIFVFQGFDAVTETVCAEWRVHIADVNQLRSILAPESDDDHGLNLQYDRLSKRYMRRIGKLCIPPIVPHAIFHRDQPTILRIRYHSISDPHQL